ncbi:DUF3021 domain-containing protein [Clostridium lundense]|uniref:DUF3021 domain-containing protein n=1 Tax=Clostridium lundense TaxID=319475 RepID=UPI000488B767|nr:DUF3021 domain-containing protein [Clostridium lundense]
MNNKYFKRGILGFCIGITVSIFISLVISLVLGDVKFYYISRKFLSYINNKLIAAIFQVFLSGVLGVAVSISMLCFEVEKWSLLQQATIHFIIMSSLMLCIFLLSPLLFIECFIILILLYFIICNVQYLFYRYKAKEINKELKKINGDNYNNKIYDKKSDKNLLKLLIIYGVLIAIFIIYDFLEINLSMDLKYVVLFILCITMVVKSVELVKSKNHSGSKVIYPIVSTLLLLITLGLNYTGFIKTVGEYTVKSTDLSKVYIDGLKIGDSLEKFNNKEYTFTDRYSNDNYNFIYEEIMISEKDNKINKIFGHADQADISINGYKAIKNLDNVVPRLGNNYVKVTYDSEQLLKQYIYVDRKNNIKVSFIYREYFEGKASDQLEYVIISKRS